MCIDFIALNKKTIKNRYPIPRIDEIMDEIDGANLFSNIDLRLGYHQNRMREEDIPKTAYICHYGHFEVVTMKFGLKNAPTTFQSCMNNIFHNQLSNFVLFFFDDILIYSKTWKEHLHHLEEVLKILHDQSLLAMLSKCEFRLKENLGHIIG